MEFSNLRGLDWAKFVYFRNFSLLFLVCLARESLFLPVCQVCLFSDNISSIRCVSLTFRALAREDCQDIQRRTNHIAIIALWNVKKEMFSLSSSSCLHKKEHRTICSISLVGVNHYYACKQRSKDLCMKERVEHFFRWEEVMTFLCLHSTRLSWFRVLVAWIRSTWVSSNSCKWWIFIFQCWFLSNAWKREGGGWWWRRGDSSAQLQGGMKRQKHKWRHN